MNPENLTTHALGEPLSPADREALEQTLQTDAQTRADFEATQAFTSFLQQNLATDHPEATLTEEQKQRLLDSRGASGSPVRNEGDRAGRSTALRWLTRAALPLSAAALILLGFQHWQDEGIPSFDPETNSITKAEAPISEIAKAPSPQEPNSLLPEVVPDQLLRAKSNLELGNYNQAREDYLTVLQKDPTNTAARQGFETANKMKMDYIASANDHTRARMLNEVNLTWEAASTPSDSPDTIGSSKDASSLASASSALPRDPAEREKLQRSLMALPDTLPIAAQPQLLPAAPASPMVAAAPAAGSKQYPPPEIPKNFGNTGAPADSFGYSNGRQSIPIADTATRDSVIRREITIPSTNESYTPIKENALTAVLREPLSTFSIDVDTASYANTRRFLNRSSLPPRDAVRIEELINYFPYNLEGPALDSPHPFAVHVEVADCPWQPQHRLARIGIQGKKVGLEQRNSNFVFLVDVSGSMNQPDKLPLVKESLRLLVEQLDEKDRVSLVTYAGSSGLVLPPTNGDQKERILAAINNMTPGGSTHGSAGIQLAYEQAIAGFIPEGVNRVILCSDGDFNVGVATPEELEKLITEKARSGVFLSVLGFGTGNLKDRTMETLADKGNGNYGYIDSLSEARKVLVEQMSGTLITIAKDVKIQVEFNPAQVASYRLIGYENRLLAKEDFNDDTKDAGEIGAGHSVTALYEIVPVGVTPPTAPVDPLKYPTPPAAAAPAAEPGTASPELLTVKLRYKAPEGATSQLIEVPVIDKKSTLAAASPEFKFTTAVAAYGLMLRQSSYRGPLSWDQIRNLALEGKGSDPHGYRAEFLQLLDKARGLMPASH